MTHYGLPILFALFVWWFSTGLIMYLDGLPRRTFKWSMIGATLLLVASLWGLHASAGQETLRGVYVAFTCGMLAWGWQEISFYMGFVTGPRRAPCPEGCSGWKHFGHAVQTSLWHELAIIVAAVIVVALAWGQPNQIGVWTFMVLWWMHQSAKLNVFLGVRNLNEEFLPEHLQFLRSFLTKKPMNLLFPISVTVSTVICVHLVRVAAAPGASALQQAGYTFLATMMALAILEHWLLVLPLPASALWGWSLRSRGVVAPFDVEVIGGFLGAGKTTFVRQVLTAPGAGPRTVVLVNDFGAVGVDGSLVRERGAEVVELPNGCICCSLKGDLARQIAATAAAFKPERLVIEPSGVADLASLVAVLSQPSLAKMVRRMKLRTVIDADAFLDDYARLTAHFEAQVRLADELVLNKTDLATPAMLMLVQSTLRALNAAAPIVPTSYGIETASLPAQPPRAIPASLPAASHAHQGAATRHEHDHAHGHAHDEHGHEHVPTRDHAHDHHDHHDHHDAHSHDEALGFANWSEALAGVVDPERLHAALTRIAGGACGRVERLKGLARSGAGWVRFDIAGGRVSLAAFAAGADEAPRVMAIGTDLDEGGLRAAFLACGSSLAEAA